MSPFPMSEKLKPVLMMLVVQLVLTGGNILYKLAGSMGLSLPILIAYRFIFAAAAILPLAFIFGRKPVPKLTWKIVLLAFSYALFGGSMAQNLYAESLVMTSATFITAIANLALALTYVFAIIFRMEVLGLKTRAGQTKLLGTILGIGGALCLCFYKGVKINIFSSHIDLLHKSQAHEAAAQQDSKFSTLGILLALGYCFSVALSYICQAKMSAMYPCHYWSTFLSSIMGAIQSGIYALCVEKDRSQWKLGWDLKLLMVVYMGILISGLMSVFTFTCMRMKGPVFVSAFNPLLLVLVALAGTFFLDEKLHLGSVVGAAVIVCSLYMVLWGKNKEVKEVQNVSMGATVDVNDSTTDDVVVNVHSLPSIQR